MNLYKKYPVLFWIVLVFVVGGSLMWMGNSGTSSHEKEVDVVVNPELLKVVSDDYKKGAVNPKVVLVEYLDFECEACGAYFPVVKELEKAFPEDLQIIIRYFPLPGHRNGMTAALAAEAAGKQDKFLEMHDLLFAEQKKWGEKAVPTPKVFETFAEQLGLDMEKFRADVASPEVKARVERDMASGIELGNTGTPSFYLNGERLKNPGGLEAFKARIQTEIDMSSQAANAESTI
jgi:protein-disulfide isomerase